MKKSSLTRFFKHLFNRQEYNPTDFNDGVNHEWSEETSSSKEKDPVAPVTPSEGIPDLHKEFRRIDLMLKELRESLPNLKSTDKADEDQNEMKNSQPDKDDGHEN